MWGKIAERFFKKRNHKHTEDKNGFLRNETIAYNFSGSVVYQSYKVVEKRIFQFDDVTNIGKDASGDYDMYLIEIGNKRKPTIMVLASLHGSEWQSTQYSLKFMEDIRDNTFPDKEFRNHLLDNYHIAYIPVGNPWGYERTTAYARIRGRNNSNRVNLNRDFYEFTQAESRNIKAVMDNLEPFSYMDCHLMAPRKDGGQNYLDLIIGNMHQASIPIRDFIADSLSLYSGREVEKWDEHTNEMHQGLSRRYIDDKNNPYTPKTFSFILEIYRPVECGNEIVRFLTDKEIMKFGIAGLYLFFKASTEHFQTKEESGR